MTHRSNFPPITRCLVVFLALLSLISTASAEWKEQVLYSFQDSPDAASPQGGVAFDKQGNLYGAALGGTAWGTVFEVSPPAKKGDSWTESVLYNFQGKAYNDGQLPSGGVIVDSAGNLYGVTAYGGSGGCRLVGSLVGCGVVYELSPPQSQGGSWTEAVLYSFQSGKDGYFPVGNLVFDHAGNLYGATNFGGGKGNNCDPDYYQYCGTVFELSPPTKKGGAWTEQVLYSFKGVDNGKPSGDGANPNGGLVLDHKGAIYGTTYYGGNNQKGKCQGGVIGTGCSIVFELTPPKKKDGKWTEKILHAFRGGNDDGGNPASGIVFSAKGDLYGTTYFGPQNGYGLVYSLAKPSGKSHAWKESTLYEFTNGKDGAYPDAGLVFHSRGSLYGTTIAGSVFRLSPPSRDGDVWTLAVLHDFTGSPDGAQPAAALVFDGAGNLYSTTIKGGTGTSCYPGDCGTVFEASP